MSAFSAVNHSINYGGTVLLERGSFRLLLPLGINYDTLEKLQTEHRISLEAAVLLAESGYATANSPLWIDKLRPQVVLLSVAAGDREGRPTPGLLEAVHGYALFCTDRNSWIELTTDGKQIWEVVESWWEIVCSSAGY